MPVTGCNLAHQRTPQVLDDVVGQLATLIETLVNNRSLFTNLREVVTVKACESCTRGVGHVDIRDAASRSLVDTSAIILNPREMTEVLLALHRNHGNVAWVFAVGIGANLEHNLLPCRLFEEAVDVVGRVQFAPIDRKNVVPRFDVHTRLRERSFTAGIPVLSVIHLRHAVTVVLETVVGPEQADFELLGLRIYFAAADEHVSDRQFSEAFLKQVREFIPRCDAVEIGSVLFFWFLEIEALIFRIVEEVALDPPRLVINLLPHGAWLNVNLPVVELERTESRLGRASAWPVIRRCSGPGVALAIENLLAIERDREVVDVFKDLIDFALAQIELLDGLAHVRLVVFRNHQRPFREKQDAGFSSKHIQVVLRRNRQ